MPKPIKHTGGAVPCNAEPEARERHHTSALVPAAVGTLSDAMGVILAVTYGAGARKLFVRLDPAGARALADKLHASANRADAVKPKEAA